ncbi:Sds3-like-domain-containing protein [Lophiotrema nucula]|uniref:Sds3-like-domain-containing protein n=1 Tax=Lophiotrema nucula TaxID=690887 RepID=A0A6A5ZCZ3_9PLEO|nr:Sds3-like-domain-containing protein [Lophiotrema nucula]
MARNRSPSPADGFPLGHSATSPQPLVSKRDKRRNMLAEKLQDMMASFTENKDSHYRAQLTALQADINLILKADPYANKPLDDAGEEAAESIAQIMGNTVPTAPSAGTDYMAQVGKYYARFVESVNDALEERDYNLTMLWNKHEKTKDETENAHHYKTHVAEEEHKLLASTIRERLTASITTRAGRLRREKEQLDLSDSNAMLLHPNQFSLNNPASPGGPQAPRKTRRTGHKFGDPDELAAAAENKRKRKLFEVENDNDSPGPSARNLEFGVGSPFREAKARTMHSQFEAAAYSLERLFTEKELNMALNHATVAASNFFAKMKNADAQEATTNGTNGAVHENGSEPGDADMDGDSDSPTGPPEMTRQISSNPHATRGATRSQLGPASIANGRIPFIHNPPFILPANTFNKPNAAAPPPPPLQPLDVEQDLMLMLRDAPPNDELNEKLLQASVAPTKAREYQIQPPDYQPPVTEITSHVRSIAPHLEVGGGGLAGLGVMGGMGGVPMSAQSSMGGYSDVGGTNTPLGRLGESSLGGLGMVRTASGSGRRGGRRAI